MSLTQDFRNETVASLLEALRRMAHDNLPLDGPIATGLKTELVRRGVPEAFTLNLIGMCRDLERLGAKVRFGDVP